MSFVCLVHERKEGNVLKILAAVAMLMACLVAAPVRPTQAASPVVILVPGYYRPSSDFDAMKAALQSQGYTVYTPTMPGQDNYANAAFLKALINQVSPNAPVSIVGHSMGGLSPRYYIKYLGGATRVTHLIDLGVPNHGNWLACLAADTNGGQMCPTSLFIYLLNVGTEVPGPTLYTAYIGKEDEVTPSKLLAAPACDFDFATLTSATHLQEPSDPVVISLVEQALVGVCPH